MIQDNVPNIEELENELAIEWNTNVTKYIDYAK
jgi:hypothetical protein